MKSPFELRMDCINAAIQLAEMQYRASLDENTISELHKFSTEHVLNIAKQFNEFVSTKPDLPK